MKNREIEIEKRLEELKNNSDGKDHTEEIMALEKELVKSVFNRIFFGDSTNNEALNKK